MSQFNRVELIDALASHFVETPEFTDLNDKVLCRLNAHARAVVVLGNEQSGRSAAISKILSSVADRALLANAVLTPCQVTNGKAKSRKDQLLADLINALSGPAALLRDTVDLPERFARLLMTLCRKQGRKRVILVTHGMEYATPLTMNLLEYVRELADSRDIELQYVFKMTPATQRNLADLLRNDGAQNLVAKQLAHGITYEPFSLSRLSNLLAEVENLAAPMTTVAGSKEMAHLVAELLPTWWESNWRLSICGELMCDAMNSVADEANRKLANVLPIPVLARLVTSFVDECSKDAREPTRGVLIKHFRTAAQSSGLREHILQM